MSLGSKNVSEQHGQGDDDGDERPQNVFHYHFLILTRLFGQPKPLATLGNRKIHNGILLGGVDRIVGPRDWYVGISPGSQMLLKDPYIFCDHWSNNDCRIVSRFCGRIRPA